MKPEVGIPYLFLNTLYYSVKFEVTLNWAKVNCVEMFIGENTILKVCPIKVVQGYNTYLGFKGAICKFLLL